MAPNGPQVRRGRTDETAAPKPHWCPFFGPRPANLCRFALWPAHRSSPAPARGFPTMADQCPQSQPPMTNHIPRNCPAQQNAAPPLHKRPAPADLSLFAKQNFQELAKRFHGQPPRRHGSNGGPALAPSAPPGHHHPANQHRAIARLLSTRPPSVRHADGATAQLPDGHAQPVLCRSGGQQSRWPRSG